MTFAPKTNWLSQKLTIKFLIENWEFSKNDDFSKFFEKSSFLENSQFSIKNLIVNFWDNQFVFGAKVIYCVWTIQIWKKKKWRARTSARATRVWTWPRMRENDNFEVILQLLGARAEIFFKFGFSIKNRWLLQQKRSKNL